MINYGKFILILHNIVSIDKTTKSPFFLFGMMCTFFTQAFGCRSLAEWSSCFEVSELDWSRSQYVKYRSGVKNKILHSTIVWFRQCGRYGGPGGPCPPNDCVYPPFRFPPNTFLEHHVTTRQQAIMEKGIITFKDNSRLKFSRLVAKLLATNCCTEM